MSDNNLELIQTMETQLKTLQEAVKKEARKAEIQKENEEYHARQEEAKRSLEAQVKDMQDNTCVLTISVEQMVKLATALVDAGFTSKSDFRGIRRYNFVQSGNYRMDVPHVVITPRYEDDIPGIMGYDVLTSSYESGMGFDKLLSGYKEFSAYLKTQSSSFDIFPHF